MFFIVVCLFLPLGQTTEVDKCIDGSPLPLRVNVVDCAKPPCKFIRTKNVTFEFDILAEEDIYNMKPRCTALAAGVKTPCPIDQKNACDGLTNGECPLDKGEEVTYKMSMEIKAEFPKVSVLIEYALTADQGQVISCFRITGLVEDPL